MHKIKIISRQIYTVAMLLVAQCIASEYRQIMILTPSVWLLAIAKHGQNTHPTYLFNFEKRHAVDLCVPELRSTLIIKAFNKADRIELKIILILLNKIMPTVFL